MTGSGLVVAGAAAAGTARCATGAVIAVDGAAFAVTEPDERGAAGVVAPGFDAFLARSSSDDQGGDGSAHDQPNSELRPRLMNSGTDVSESLFGR